MKKRTLKNKIIQAGVLLGLSFIILPGTVSCNDNGEKGKLLQELRSSDAFARELAVVRLGELKFISAVEPLIDTLKDKEPLVRQAAVRSLGQIVECRERGQHPIPSVGASDPTAFDGDVDCAEPEPLCGNAAG